MNTGLAGYWIGWTGRYERRVPNEKGVAAVVITVEKPGIFLIKIYRGWACLGISITRFWEKFVIQRNMLECGFVHERHFFTVNWV